MNKTIYMTYKKEIPSKVFRRWDELNPGYKIELSLNDDCYKFLRENFNEYVAWLFMQIPEGANKADLWRLCKLYICGGVYADVDLVPLVSLDKIFNENPEVTWYSCLSGPTHGIFQAFIASTKPKNPLLLSMIISFLQNNPFSNFLEPTFDMRNCLNDNFQNVLPNIKMTTSEVKIKINFGNSSAIVKTVPLHYFPEDVQYYVRLCPTHYGDTFEFKISSNMLFIRRTDKNHGWDHSHSCIINIRSDECVYLFNESSNVAHDKYGVYYKNQRILDSRDPEYYANGGW